MPGIGAIKLTENARELPEYVAFPMLRGWTWIGDESDAAYFARVNGYLKRVPREHFDHLSYEDVRIQIDIVKYAVGIDTLELEDEDIGLLNI